MQSRIEQDIQATLKNVWEAYHKEQSGQAPQEPTTEPQPEENTAPEQEPTTEPSEEPQQEPEPTKEKQRVRINDKEEHTLKILLELEAQEPQREYLSTDITAITKRSIVTDTRHLKTLWEQGKLNRDFKNRKHYYSLAMKSSKTVSQNPMSDNQNLTE